MLRSMLWHGPAAGWPGQTRRLTRRRKRFLVIGGDHSCAIGTWSGAADALHHSGPLGLICGIRCWLLCDERLYDVFADFVQYLLNSVDRPVHFRFLYNEWRRHANGISVRRKPWGSKAFSECPHHVRSTSNSSANGT